ncbi:keratin, type I cytoskeletal 9-like isoform X2 [Atheta coriaria]|uniref:keratin, type I cytoskeletal 9-like isoform X2 n=1 Tax=Dalotia coriaria TaxID=877792 RepID=UPI0031F36EE6
MELWFVLMAVLSFGASYMPGAASGGINYAIAGGYGRDDNYNATFGRKYFKPNNAYSYTSHSGDYSGAQRRANVGSYLDLTGGQNGGYVGPSGAQRRANIGSYYDLTGSHGGGYAGSNGAQRRANIGSYYDLTGSHGGGYAGSNGAQRRANVGSLLDLTGGLGGGYVGPGGVQRRNVGTSGTHGGSDVDSTGSHSAGYDGSSGAQRRANVGSFLDLTGGLGGGYVAPSGAQRRNVDTSGNQRRGDVDSTGGHSAGYDGSSGDQSAGNEGSNAPQRRANDGVPDDGFGGDHLRKVADATENVLSQYKNYYNNFWNLHDDIGRRIQEVHKKILEDNAKMAKFIRGETDKNAETSRKIGAGFAAASFGNKGLLQSAVVNPANPSMPNRRNAFQPVNLAPSGKTNFKGFMTASSTHTHNVNGVPKTKHVAETVVNNNGKVTVQHVESP